MNESKRYAEVIARLRDAGLRPTRQRIALGDLMFVGCDRHISAEMLHKEAVSAGISVSMATVYNTLNQFTAAGLLREIAVDSGRSYFDTNIGNHHHFYFERSGELVDIPSEDVVIAQLPPAPKGAKVSRIDVVVRVEEN